MYLVQILLPVNAKGVTASEDQLLAALHSTLVETFGGLTAYNRAPASGKWLAHGKEEQDTLIVLEVMTETLDREWWKRFRVSLETQLAQEEIVIRSQQIERL